MPTSRSWNLVEEHLDRLLDVPEHERAAALEVLRESNLDPKVVRLIETSLDDDFMPGPVGDVAPGLLADLAEEEGETHAWIGRRFGAWRAIGHLGSGGMGSVFLVERDDGQYQQRAALKLLSHPGDSGVVERFRLERQILAGLDHPRIARLLDGGASDDGLPYLVMEYVDGERIDQHCDRSDLDLRRRLELFLSVCDAVQSAHQNLIVHRDLKPANILVDRDGRVKLLDFGIAKLLESHRDAADVTRTRSHPLTPEYAAPEQLRNEPITTATDVYALGVLLYRLLTGREPFALSGAGLSEIVKTICENDPAVPSRKTSSIPKRRLEGDLDAIVLKAMSKRPEDRYRSVEQMAADIRAHLAGQPVSAASPTVRERAWKFVRHHRWGVGVATAMVMLTSGTVAFHTMRLAAEREQAQSERDRAEATAAFLVDLFEALEPSTSRADFGTAARLIDSGTTEVSRLTGHPLLQGDVLTVLGRVSYAMGRIDRAEAHLREAVEHYRSIHPEDHPYVAAARSHLGFVLWKVGKVDEAQELLRDIVEENRRGDGSDGSHVTKSLNLLAQVRRDQGYYEEAELLHRQVLKMRRERERPSSAAIAVSLDNLGTALENQGRLDEAEGLYRQALEMNREVWGPKHILVATNMSHLGRLLTSKGALADAEPLLRDALQMKQDLWGDGHLEVASTLCNLAELLRRRGAEGEPGQLLEEALDIYRGVDNRPGVAMALSIRGDIRLDRAEYPEAEADYLRALDLLTGSVHDTHPKVRDSLRRLAYLYQSWGKHEQASEYRTRLLTWSRTSGREAG